MVSQPAGSVSRGREYHDHQSHQDVSWAALRSDRRYSVLQLLMQLRTDLNATGVNKQ